MELYQWCVGAFLTLAGIYIAFRGFLLAKAKNEAEKKRIEEEERNEIKNAIEQLRLSAETALKEHCDKSEKIIEPILRGMEEMNVRLSVMETKNNFIYSYLEKSIASILKSPVHPEKDILLSHMAKGDLSLEEAEALRNIFDHEKDLEENKGHLWAYISGIILLDNRIHELRKGHKVSNEQYGDDQQ